MALILIVVGLFVTIPIATGMAYNVARSVRLSVLTDSRASLPNYDNVYWADQHFKDLTKITSSYSDFVVWEFNPLSTETINIGEQSVRHTVVPELISSDEIWMFGGSTVFGTGADDSNTIPSLLAEYLNSNVVNFGQDGYVGRQSVIRLIREYNTGNSGSVRGRTVVFYDGINDVNVKCRYENHDLVTDRQSQIRSAVGNNRAAEDYSFVTIFRPAQVLIRRIIQRIPWGIDAHDVNVLFACDTDGRRAEQVAGTLVGDWRTARAIAESNGDRFVAILQPVSYLSDTRTDHLIDDRLDGERAKQFAIVYPLIRRDAIASGIEFYDLSDALNIDDYLFIDHSHLSPNGNEYIARELSVRIR